MWVQSEVDVDIGCSSDIIVQNMRKTELVTTTAAAEPKHIAVRLLPRACV